VITSRPYYSTRRKHRWPSFRIPSHHHPVRANRPGFPGDKNPRNSGRLAGRGRSANRIPAVLPWSAPNITGQSLRAKFRFPGCTTERPAFRNLAIAGEQGCAFLPPIICAKMPQCRDERRNCYPCSDGRLLSLSKQHHTSEPTARQLEFWADCLWLGHASKHQQFGRESALWPRSAPQVRS
jgi:hypothetical protein